MHLLISILDFPDFVPFSVNIDPALVNPHIRDAQTFDVPLSADLRRALELALSVVMPQFNPKEFDTDEFQTNAVTAGWADVTLATLWYTGVRPLLVCHAARRMLLGHGFHITPNGVETISDVGHMPITAAQRTELRSDYQARCAHYRPLFDAALRAYQPPGATSCTTHRRRPQAGGNQSYAI